MKSKIASTNNTHAGIKGKSTAPKVESRAIAPEEFLTTHELMRLLKIKHRQTVYTLIKDGMPVIKVGKNYRFIKKEVIDFLKKQSESINSKDGDS